MAHSRTKGRYYKDNPRAVKARDAKRMYVGGVEISKYNPLHTPGRYASWQDAWNNNELDSKTTTGHIYAIGNPAWPEWIKIGKAVDALDRLNGYQTSSPYRDYFLIHSKYVENRSEAESIAHETLINMGFKNKGEWFKVSSTTAINIIDNTITISTQQDLFDEDSS
tara:strand:- start:16934 stop:17431 length:498 start_codon:yes stop_codon:yes gene_type:complete